MLSKCCEAAHDVVAAHSSGSSVKELIYILSVSLLFAELVLESLYA